MKGYAVVPVPDFYENKRICRTSAPEILGGGLVWQIYTNRPDAEYFCTKIPFADAAYEVVEVDIILPTDRN